MFKMIGEYISRNGDGDLGRALELFEYCCRHAVNYGVKLLVLHLWGGQPSDKHIGVNIAAYPKLKAISDKYNLPLTVENIVCNSQRPLGHMKKLWELYPNDIKFTFDVRQAEFHKSVKETCECAFLWENNLVEHLHIHEYKGGHMDWDSLWANTPLTQGDVDFEFLFAFLKSIDYGGSVAVETNTFPGGDGITDSLNKIYDFVKNGLS